MSKLKRYNQFLILEKFDDNFKAELQRLGITDEEEINPIYFSKNENKSDAIEIKLNPGDLCLYHGCDLYHWRPPFTQKWYLQAFLHYVNADGPHKDHLYDKRPYLGMPK